MHWNAAIIFALAIDGITLIDHHRLEALFDEFGKVLDVALLDSLVTHSPFQIDIHFRMSIDVAVIHLPFPHQRIAWLAFGRVGIVDTNLARGFIAASAALVTWSNSHSQGFVLSINASNSALSASLRLSLAMRCLRYRMKPFASS